MPAFTDRMGHVNEKFRATWTYAARAPRSDSARGPLYPSFPHHPVAPPLCVFLDVTIMPLEQQRLRQPVVIES
jgi:hypothetical protein